MSSITIPDQIETGYDIVVIGGGFAGSVIAHYLKKEDPNVSLLIVEKEYIGAHEASYYVPKSLVNELGLQDYIVNKINKFTYSVDNSDFKSEISTGGEILVISYREVCSHLTKGIETIKGEFINYVDRSKKIINIEREDESYILAPKIIIDASGWESSVRKSIPNLSLPEIGCITYLLELENCNRNYEWDNMTLEVGDISSYFWIEPNNLEKGIMKVGIGLWKPLNDNSDNYETEIQKRMYIYLNRYRSIFKNSFVRNEYFAKISADPVREIVYNSTVFFGEAVGMTNPYWLLGANLILNYAKQFAPIIHQSVKNTKHLVQIQEIWDTDFSKYGKLWAGARILWMEDSTGWLYILKKREKLNKYTEKEQIIERQSGGSYSIPYLYKMWGPKRLGKAILQLLIFKFRLSAPWFRDRYTIKYRNNFVDIADSSTNKIITEMQLVLEKNKTEQLIQEELN